MRFRRARDRPPSDTEVAELIELALTAAQVQRRLTATARRLDGFAADLQADVERLKRFAETVTAQAERTEHHDQ